MGRTHALELVRANRRASGASRVICGLPATLTYIDDGRLEIDNNIVERALRGVAVRRPNWLFAGSKTGGERAAAIYTVIQTCKANGVDPQVYIADVTGKIAADWPAARWDELIPWNWAPQTGEPVVQAA
jgi:transposase